MIDDGYTLCGHLTLGEHSLQFDYRPMLDHERRALVERIRVYRPSSAESLVAARMSEHVWWWDYKMAPSVRGMVMLSVESPSLYRLLYHVILGVQTPHNDVGWTRDWEIRDSINLRDGSRLELLNPLLAHRDCGHCKKWWYNEETGKIAHKAGKPLRRQEGTPVMCEVEEGCPKGTPENPRSLIPKNRRALAHYRECRHTNSFPIDPIVRRNAAILGPLFAELEKTLGRTI